MIRISLISKHYKQIEPLIQQFFNDLQIEYKLTNYTHQTIQDIYFVEIEKKNEKSNLFIIMILFKNKFKKTFNIIFIKEMELLQK